MINSETFIDDLDLSVRAYNCLKRAGYNTVGDITDAIEHCDNDPIQALGRVRNLGQKNLDEILEKIKYKPHINTHYEEIMNMSITDMAKQNVRSITTTIGYTPTTLFIASDGFDSTDKDEVIEHELNWLRSAIE